MARVETGSQFAVFVGGKTHDVMGRDDKVAAFRIIMTFKTESGLPRAQCANRPEILEERSH